MKNLIYSLFCLIVAALDPMFAPRVTSLDDKPTPERTAMESAMRRARHLMADDKNADAEEVLRAANFTIERPTVGEEGDSWLLKQELVEVLLRQEKNGEALRLAAQVRRHIQCDGPLFQLGILLARTGSEDESRRLFTPTLITKNIKHADFLKDLPDLDSAAPIEGLWLLASGVAAVLHDDSDALYDFSAAKRFFPTSPYVALKLGESLSYAQRWSEALKELEFARAHGSGTTRHAASDRLAVVRVKVKSVGAQAQKSGHSAKAGGYRT